MVVNKFIKLAKQAIGDEFSGKETRSHVSVEFKEKRGVFVTLTKNKELRGCIGFPYPILPLGEAIIKAARSAAFSDPRFAPLSEKELGGIKVEISVLTVPEKVEAVTEQLIENIKVGKDGLICEYQGFSGLLLPQVATEQGWNAEQFLRALCGKAGIPLDSWKEKDFKLLKFQAEIVKEE